MWILSPTRALTSRAALVLGSVFALALSVAMAPPAAAHGGGWGGGNPVPPPSPEQLPPTTPPPPPPPPSPPDSTETLPPPTTDDTPPPPPPPTSTEPPTTGGGTPPTPAPEPPTVDDPPPPVTDGGDDVPPVTEGGEEPPPAPEADPPITEPAPDSCGGGGPPPPPPPAGGPQTGPAPTPTLPGAAGPTTGRGLPPASLRSQETQWGLWWSLNRWQYLPTRAEMLRRRSERITGSDASASLLAAWETRRALLAKSVALPYLWQVLNPASRAPEEVQAAALIALGRLARSEAAIDLVLHYAMHPRKTQLIRESAVIALGHFRRSDPAQQFDATRLDLLRRQLIAIFDDGHTPVRARAFAALSVGMLADQPYSGSFAKQGRLVTRELWDRYQRGYASHDLPVALLTALGMQPPGGVPEEVREGLQGVALGKRVHRRRHSSIERSHALAARVKLGGRGFAAMLGRVLSSRKVPADVRRAGFIGLAARAASLDTAERLSAFQAWQAGMRRARAPLTKGLGYIALAQLLAADLRAPAAESRLLSATDAGARLAQRVGSGDATVRGFAAVALGLAARDAAPDRASAMKFRVLAITALKTQLANRRGDDEFAGACVVGLGLIRDTGSVGVLSDLLRDRRRSPALRGYAATALAQIGDRSAKVMVGLQAALMDRRDSVLRREAALALSFLARGSETSRLVGGLDRSRSQRTLAQTALALGRLGQLDAVKPVLAAARDRTHNDEPRALAISALGLILNPEDRPSLSRIRFNANYPARTNALHEVFDIL